jgi:predicted  nucleic acid-binding Zn-ribbon protein
MSYHHVEDNFRELERRIDKMEDRRNLAVTLNPDFQQVREQVEDLQELVIAMSKHIKRMQAAIEELSLA